MQSYIQHLVHVGQAPIIFGMVSRPATFFTNGGLVPSMFGPLDSISCVSGFWWVKKICSLYELPCEWLNVCEVRDWISNHRLSATRINTILNKALAKPRE